MGSSTCQLKIIVIELRKKDGNLQLSNATRQKKHLKTDPSSFALWRERENP